MARKPKKRITKYTRKTLADVLLPNLTKISKRDREALDMPERRKAFIDFYMVHYNGSRAAREAGYSEKAAAPTASLLLRDAKVSAEIKRRRAQLAENLENIANERIQYELAAVGLANMQDFAPLFGDGAPADNLDLLTREQAAAVAEITVEEFRDGRSDYRQVRRTKFKLAPKVPALELLAKTRGMLIEKVDHKHVHNHTILAVLMEKIAADQSGKPIVEVEVLPADKTGGEAA